MKQCKLSLILIVVILILTSTSVGIYATQKTEQMVEDITYTEFKYPIPSDSLEWKGLVFKQNGGVSPNGKER